MKLQIIYTLCAMLIVITSGCGNGPEAAATEQPEEMIELSINYSIGIEIGDSTEVFGSITDVCHDTAGQILVLDQTLCGVKVFSDDGEYICQIGRNGSGPREMLMPLYVAGLNDGRILVHDPMNNAFISYDSTFNYLENISLWSNGPPLETCAVAQSSYAGVVLEFDMETDQPRMIRTLATSSETYEVFAFNADGSDLFHITRDIPRVEKTAQEMEDEIMYVESWANRIGMQGVVIEWEPDPYRTFIKALGVGGSGHLWVARGTELEPVFDVYDMSGAHLFTARLSVESGSWKFHIDSYGIIGWEEDPPDGFQKLYIIDFPAV